MNSGLEYLSTVDTILVHQEINLLLEELSPFPRKNRYRIMNSDGEIKYYAMEKSSRFARRFLANKRPFHMRIVNNDAKRDEVIRLHRPYAMPFSLEKIFVYAPAPNVLAGSVEQVWACCKVYYNLKNAQGEVVLKIISPMCQIRCCSSIDFDVYSEDGISKVGKISKHWTGLTQAITDQDNFGISFPVRLDVQMKAVLIGACFLISQVAMYRRISKMRELQSDKTLTAKATKNSYVSFRLHVL